jgi:hypothetical protein
VSRDRAKARMEKARAESIPVSMRKSAAPPDEAVHRPKPRPRNVAQLSLEDFLSSPPKSEQR